MERYFFSLNTPSWRGEGKCYRICFHICGTLNDTVSCVNSGFYREVDEICALLGNYVAYSGNSVPKFRDNLTVPSSRVKYTKRRNKDPFFYP